MYFEVKIIWILAINAEIVDIPPVFYDCMPMTDAKDQSLRDHAKAVIAPLRAALYDFDGDRTRRALENTFDRSALVRLAFPFEDLDGPGGFFANAITPLAQAFPDLERRDTIVMAGAAESGDVWVGCCGYYAGKFTRPFLDVPPTDQLATMRYHEFFRVDGGKIVEFQGLWDIPELMHQAGAWPMAPQLGRDWYAPGPASQDGLSIENKSDAHAAKSLSIVRNMCADLGNFAEGGVEAMRLEKYWHPRSSWYGPFGIGAARGIDGFRHRHQIPFLNGMPNRAGTGGYGAFFADGDFVGVTGWPNMSATITGDGWMGIAPAGQEITMRSLDFWRVENGLVRENWVLVDLLSVYNQIGVDVFARMKELTKAKS